MNRNRWRDIRKAIKQDIVDGVLETGSKLPTEPELSAHYEAGRHSVRRAIADLARSGHVSVEQGRGTFVQLRPMIIYPIGRRTRLSNIARSQGMSLSGQYLGVDQLEASPEIADNLGVKPGAPVIATRRLTLADGIPVSFGTLFHDAVRFPDFPERRDATGSTTAVYATFGIDDYVRLRTTIHSRPARSEEARLLRQSAEMPVNVVRAVDATIDGTPIACSKVIWSSARVKFTLSTEA